MNSSVGLLEHLREAYVGFEGLLPELVRTAFFPRGVLVGGQVMPIEARSVTLLPPETEEEACFEARRPFLRRLVADLILGDNDCPGILIGSLPALTGGGTLLYGPEPVLERIAILQLRPLSEVRLARTVARLTKRGGTTDLGRAKSLLVRHNAAHNSAWNLDSIAGVDTSPDLSNYRIVSLQDLLVQAVRSALTEMTIYWGSHPPESPAEVMELFFPCLPCMFGTVAEARLTRSGLVQPLDTLNPVAELAHKRKVTFCGVGGVRNLHGGMTPERSVDGSHFGRLCPVETPESAHIGLNLHLALGANVRKGKLEATNPQAASGLLGLCASLIPFVEHDDMNRAMMGAKNMKQALPLSEPEAPLVKTGLEARVVQEGALRSCRAVAKGELALGANLRIAYLPWYGYNFEDAIVVSDFAAVRLTSLHGIGESQEERPLRIGDKLTGRHGNKGVVSRIVPRDEMPRLCIDGQPIDVLLNPHGVISRMNIGQLLETHWGWIAHRQGRSYVAPPFSGAGNRERVATELEASGMPGGKSDVTWVGLDGKPKSAHVVVGYQYLMKLDHCAADKLQVRATGPRTMLTQQPPRSRKGGVWPAIIGGQRVGEMETWALQAHMATNNLREMLGVKSEAGTGAMPAAFPETMRVLLVYLRAMGIDTTLRMGPKGGEEVAWDATQADLANSGALQAQFRFADEENVRVWADGKELTEISVWQKGDAWHPDGLMGKNLFGPDEHRERRRGAYISLHTPVPHPLASKVSLCALYVPPPVFRPLSRWDAGLNIWYRKILVANRRLKRSGTVADARHIRSLVQAVAGLFGRAARFGRDGSIRYGPAPEAACRSSLPARLEGKGGLLRGYLLGKRVDFSGRAVIVPDPSLPFGRCRLPRAAQAIFDRSGPCSVDSTGADRPIVLLNRAPSLHRYNLLAFGLDAERPFVDDAVLALHPLACGCFGADFDGDTMAFHLPLGRDACEEAWDRLAADRNLFSAAHGGLLLHLTQDIVAGVYLMTLAGGADRQWLQETLADDALAQDGTPMTGEILQAAVQRRLRAALAEPSESPTEPSESLADALSAVDTLMRRAFQEVTERGLSFAFADLEALCICRDAVAEAAREAPSADALRVRLGAILKDRLCVLPPDHSVAVLILSGARGDVKQLARLCGAVTRLPDGSATTSYLEGLSPGHYFEAAKEARQDMMPKKLGTPVGGDLTRKLVYGLYPLRIVVDRCQAEAGLRLPPDLAAYVLGKHLAEAIPGVADKGALIDVLTLEGLIGCGEPFCVHSPVTCRAEGGVCARCYGWDLSTERDPELGLPVGILAAQSIGERATQDFMKVFQGAGSGVSLFDDAKAFLESGTPPSPGAGKNALPQNASSGELLRWLTVTVYRGEVNLRHFETAFRGMCVGDKRPGVVRAARALATASPFAAAAFQSPVRVLVRAAMVEDVDPLTIGAAPLFIGRTQAET